MCATTRSSPICRRDADLRAGAREARRRSCAKNDLVDAQHALGREAVHEVDPASSSADRYRPCALRVDLGLLGDEVLGVQHEEDEVRPVHAT